MSAGQLIAHDAPWRTEFVEAGSIWVLKSGDSIFAFAYEKADADFIAAAPELLAALKDAAAQLEADAAKLRNSVHGRKLAALAEKWRGIISKATNQ